MTLSQRWHKGNLRYYQIYLQKDLLNFWTLTCVWGGINSRLGNCKTYTFERYEDALEEINRLKVRRSKRGYSIVNH